MKLPWRPALVLLVLASVGLLIYLAVVPRVSVDALRSRVAAELPPGTSCAAVEAWFTRRGLKFGRVNEAGDTRPVVVGCVIKNVYRTSLFGEYEIELECHFDADGRLSASSVEQFFYSSL
jgi:hypothetical protein